MFSTSKEQLLDYVFAVHATPILPEDGILKTGRLKRNVNGEIAGYYTFRQTLHFALGGLVQPHEAGNWEKVSYAVITPLRTLQKQLINLNPYDTIIMGEFELSQKCIVVIPKGDPYRSKKGEHVVPYEPEMTTLRATIDKVIDAYGGWKINTYPGMGEANSVAECPVFPSENLCAPTFWKSILHPNLSFGPTHYSVQGFASKVTNLDSIIEELSILYCEDCMWKYEIEMRFLRLRRFLKIYLKHHLNILKSTLPERMKDHYAKMEKETEGWLYIIELDLYVKNRYGKSMTDFYDNKIKHLIEKRLEQFKRGEKPDEKERDDDYSLIERMAQRDIPGYYRFIGVQTPEAMLRLRQYHQQGFTLKEDLTRLSWDKQATLLYELSGACEDYQEEEFNKLLTEVKQEYYLQEVHLTFLNLLRSLAKASINPCDETLDSLHEVIEEIESLKVEQYKQICALIGSSSLHTRFAPLKQNYEKTKVPLRTEFQKEVIEYYTRVMNLGKA